MFYCTPSVDKATQGQVRVKREADPKAFPEDLLAMVNSRPESLGAIQRLVEKDFLLRITIRTKGKRISVVRIVGPNDNILALAIDGVRYYLTDTRTERKQYLGKAGKVVTVYRGREAEHVKHLFMESLIDMLKVNPSVTVRTEQKFFVIIKCPHQFYEYVNKIVSAIDNGLTNCVSEVLTLQSGQVDLARTFAVSHRKENTWYCLRGHPSDGGSQTLEFYGRDQPSLTEGLGEWTAFLTDPGTVKSKGQYFS